MNLVPIPVFDHTILADGPKVVAFFFEEHLRHAFFVGEYRFVTVTEVEAPNLDILVRRTCHDEFGITRDVHGQHW